jgi:glycosyltransferase involved in cell wall biosynthesis
LVIQKISVIERQVNLSISVVIPVYNCESYIAAAIDSVISQTCAPVELIVVDDGSTDGTKEVVGRYGDQIRYLQKEHSGTGDSLNQGVSEASGEYIAFLDSDDLWVRNKIELQRGVLNTVDVDMVFGYMQQFVSPELNEADKAKIHCPEAPIPGYSRDTILLRKETFLRVGLFATDLHLGEFIDWYSRAQALGLTSFMLQEVVAKRRLHTTNMTGQHTAQKIDYARIMKANLDRRRALAKLHE